jgi:hypothetical protein
MAADDYDDAGRYEQIVVKRAVYEAGLKLYEDEKAGRLDGDKCFWAAERRAEEYEAAGKTEDAVFWRAVQSFAFEYDVCMDKETKLVILEEGEVYKPPEEDDDAG